MAAQDWTRHLTPQLWIRLTCQKENVYHGSPAWPFGAFPLAKTPHHFDPKADIDFGMIGWNQRWRLEIREASETLLLLLSISLKIDSSFTQEKTVS